MAEYRYLLRDVATGDIQGEVPFESASYSDIFNAPGAFSGTLALIQPSAVSSMLATSLGLLDLGRLTLFVERDGVLIWGGFIWTAESDFDAGTCTFNGEGFHSYFRRRVIAQTLTYTGIDQTLIAKDLIDKAQSTSGYGNVGVLTSGVTASGKLRDRTYDYYDTKNYGDALEDLAAVNDGFIFRYEPQWNGNLIEVRFLTTYPDEGRLTDHIFDVENNVASGRTRHDATTLATRVTTIGATLTGAAHPLQAALWNNTALDVDKVPLLDDVVTLSDVNIIETLVDHAMRRLNAGNMAMMLPEVDIDPETSPPLGSYLIGDRVTVRGSIGFESYNSLLRVIERKVSVDESGQESVNLTFSNVTPQRLRYSSAVTMLRVLTAQRNAAIRVQLLERRRANGSGGG